MKIAWRSISDDVIDRFLWRPIRSECSVENAQTLIPGISIRAPLSSPYSPMSFTRAAEHIPARTQGVGSFWREEPSTAQFQTNRCATSIPRRWRRQATARALRRRRARAQGPNRRRTVIEHVSMVGDLKAHAHILFDQQHGNAFRAHLRDDTKDFAHDQRRQPLRWFVKNEKFWIKQQCACDGQHFLLASGELPPAA